VLDRPAIYRHFQKRQAKLTLYSNLFKKISGHKGTHKAFSIGKLLKKNLKQADARPHHLLLLKMTVCQLNLTFLVDF
jgi:hypothetical protein